ncbi:hypothetical protein QPK32_12275 [Massilia sp. YIM B02763]|uniref:hypothetical protein n=1 Tax=Massilia sp. YIM B02763 TaxID=3050130 RepID=UPI0025B6CB69|nr:hypothetical protein [Massilia sp. YIM B02763]MDN4053855.1 hypothetical protein [Massilia sp. YIM B02763]
MAGSWQAKAEIIAISMAYVTGRGIGECEHILAARISFSYYESETFIALAPAEDCARHR